MAIPGASTVIEPMPASQVSLGIIAGGSGSRLGGVDKAWLLRDGVPQVLRWQRRFAPQTHATLVSANSGLERYAALGLVAVGDRHPGAGPLAGLDALAQACATPWLLTVPVDLVGTNDCLLPTLCVHAGTRGAYATDDAGVQPLVALWNVAALRAGAAEALADGSLAVHRLQASLGMAAVRFAGVRFGNINTPAELEAAGMQLP